MALEREHKFLVETFPALAQLREVYSRRGLELRLSAPRQQTDVYYDTPQLTLLRSGAALRIRRFGDDTVAAYDSLIADTPVTGTPVADTLATYKESGTVAGSLHARDETEAPYVAPWPPAILTKLAPLGVLKTLAPLLQLSTRRVRYLLYESVVQNGKGEAVQRAELSLDEVTSSHGAQQISFRELELEAHPDTPDDAFAALAEVLREEALREFELTPHSGDKLTHALTLLGLLDRPT